MITLSTYIFEKLLINKDTKISKAPINLVKNYFKMHLKDLKLDYDDISFYDSFDKDYVDAELPINKISDGEATICISEIEEYLAFIGYKYKGMKFKVPGKIILRFKQC